MKMQSNKLRNWGLAMAFLAIGNPLVTSCSKDQNSTEVAPISDKLTISISGINVDPSFKSASNDLSYDVQEFGDADIAISIGDVNQSDAVKFRNSSVYEPVEQDVQYVVYIYEGNNLVASKLLSAGTPGTIDDLNPTTNYKWVAVSYNSTESAPSIAPAAALALPENTDVLYASGDLNLSQNSSIDIAFNHAMARFAVELNTIGVFGEISAQTAPTITLTSGGLRTGDLNLLTGDITASSTTFSPTLTYNDFEQVEENKNDILQTYFYTVPSGASENQSVNVSISNLLINHYDGNQSRTYFSGGANFPLSIAAEKGKSRKATLNIVESALETQIAGAPNIGWARSNLYFREGAGIDDKRAYAFNYINRMHATGNSYFAFNTKKPLYFPQTNADLGDPCLEVYPKNLWRTPTDVELGALASGTINIAPLVDEVVGTLGNILNGVLGSLLGGAAAPNSITTSVFNAGQLAGKTEYNTSIIQRGRPTGNTQNAFGNGDSQSNKLTFFYNGQVTNTTVLQSLGSAENSGLISLRTSDLNASSSGTLLGLNVPILPAYSNTAALWSSTDGINLLGLVGAGSWGYFSYQNVALGGLVTQGSSNARTSAELLDIELLGLGLIESSLKNVRCVRSTAPVFD